MQIYAVNGLTREYISLNVEENDTILQLKIKVANRVVADVNLVCLYYGGMNLADGRTLFDYNMYDGATIYYAIRLISTMKLYFTVTGSNKINSTQFQTTEPLEKALNIFQPYTLPELRSISTIPIKYHHSKFSNFVKKRLEKEFAELLLVYPSFQPLLQADEDNILTIRLHTNVQSIRRGQEMAIVHQFVSDIGCEMKKGRKSAGIYQLPPELWRLIREYTITAQHLTILFSFPAEYPFKPCGVEVLDGNMIIAMQWLYTLKHQLTTGWSPQFTIKELIGSIHSFQDDIHIHLSHHNSCI